MRNRKSRSYINPYLGGVLLGLTVLAANYISGRGLGASGAMKNAIVASVEAVAPAHAENAAFYKEFNETHTGSPLNSWLVYQMLGVLAGGFLSGVIARRMTWKVEHSPKISSKTRLVAALAGGILFGFGSQLGRGCTSGSALSGMAVLSLGGFLSMMAIFGTAFALAYFVRKLWI
ncbi:MAG: YeeE/YedE family protein [Bacteroidales bacterium]|nr:YeeE/YedE family protein [Bacteroidales bacterium]MCF8350866.1 YeeE/YedE family protein [Bacteroidales bacterium]MCF8374860.1 YeeE/YedE family protein [Bacteroidales bacterium]